MNLNTQFETGKTYQAWPDGGPGETDQERKNRIRREKRRKKKENRNEDESSAPLPVPHWRSGWFPGCGWGPDGGA